MRPRDVDAFAGNCADALAEYERGLQEQADFEAEYEGTYRRLRSLPLDEAQPQSGTSYTYEEGMEIVADQAERGRLIMEQAERARLMRALTRATATTTLRSRPAPRPFRGGRAPRSSSQRRVTATRNKSPGRLAGDDSDPEPSRPLDLLDAVAFSLGWARCA